MKVRNLDYHIKKWTRENAPLGRELGYPECCIKSFCAQPPYLLKLRPPTTIDKIRFEAAKLDGRFSGFIPCYTHALEILNGERSLESLINNRSAKFAPFPNQFENESL